MTASPSMVGFAVSGASSSPVLMTNHGTAQELPSPGRLSGDAGMFSGFDMGKLRRHFPEAFAAFLREDLKGYSVEALAILFSTDEKTIRNWRAGKCAPSGPVVAVVISLFPHVLPRLMRAAA